ncbi:hypothetical protein BFP71_11800 [Roseivirga misakiensis]|uniref:Uncharacterized protein n=2 Tax=Roseivirga misakiensis TaxID=1563681 RepID=A0A1E5SYF7_9BACT|nr:hypothetical protein BFP71_11800 [Roseivirga misakiensis]
MEISKVTLDNFLKKWDGAPLINNIKGTEATHKSGEGITFTITATNARILMNTQNRFFRNGDSEIMKLFYSSQIIELQKERLLTALEEFLEDFNSYLPLLSEEEQFKVVFDVKDEEIKKDGKVIPAAKGSDQRTYQLVAKWNVEDLENFKNGKLSADQFNEKITVEKE